MSAPPMGPPPRPVFPGTDGCRSFTRFVSPFLSERKPDPKGSPSLCTNDYSRPPSRTGTPDTRGSEVGEREPWTSSTRPTPQERDRGRRSGLRLPVASTPIPYRGLLRSFASTSPFTVSSSLRPAALSLRDTPVFLSPLPPWTGPSDPAPSDLVSDSSGGCCRRRRPNGPACDLKKVP